MIIEYLKKYFTKYSLIELQIMYNSLDNLDQELLKLKLTKNIANYSEINTKFYKYLLPKMKKILTRKTNKMKAYKELILYIQDKSILEKLISEEFKLLLKKLSLKEAILISNLNLSDPSLLNLLNIDSNYLKMGGLK